jgi:hypothetical protein
LLANGVVLWVELWFGSVEHILTVLRLRDVYQHLNFKHVKTT